MRNIWRSDRIRFETSRALATAAVLFLSATSCQIDAGVEGGVNAINQNQVFPGIGAATILSPTSVKVSWDVTPGYSSYQVFSSSSGSTIGTSLFSSLTVTGLSPQFAYAFSVGATASNANGGTLDGISKKITVTTWPQFAGIVTLNATSPTSLQASWSFPASGPTFRVYVAQGSAPTNFALPAATTTGNTVGITTLADGTALQPNTTYYAVVRASYLDNSSESNSLSAHVTTPPKINPLPVVTTDGVILGDLPTFSVSGALPTYTTTFKLGTVTLASISGNGSIKASAPLTAGLNSVTTTVSAGSDSANLPNTVIYSRKLDNTMKEYPNMSSGKGYQRLGRAMAVGDFNCDGYQDVAMAASEGIFTGTGAMNYVSSAGAMIEGAVYIFYGSNNGLITAPAPTTSSSAPNPLLLLAPTKPYSNHFFGGALSAGNINADSFGGHACDDLVVSNRDNYNSSCGDAVWVFFGSPSGLQQGSPVTNSSACFGQSCSPLLITNTAEAGCNYFGWQDGNPITVGCLHRGTGPGGKCQSSDYRDIVIGAPADANYATHAPGGTLYGAVFIYYGSPQGVDFSGSPAATRIYAPTGQTSTDNTRAFGYSVAAVDLDNDGVDDLVVGSPRENSGKGAFYYYSSATSSLTNTIANPSGKFPATPFLPTAYAPTAVRYTNPVWPNGPFFGGTLANAGDLNGDGKKDLFVSTGSHGLTVATTNNQFYIYYGGSGAPQTGNGCTVAGTAAQKDGTSVCTTGATTSCTGTAPNLTCKILAVPYGSGTDYDMWYGINPPSDNAAAGRTDTNGYSYNDVNGDGISDLVVGWVSPTTNISRAAVYAGSTSGLQVTPSKVKPNTSWWDNIGWSVATGLLNSDGFADVVVAAPDDTLLNGAQGGVAYVFNGRAGGLPVNATDYSATVAANLSKETPHTMSISPFAAPIGDINGDGYTDAMTSLCRPSPYRTSASISGIWECDLIVYHGSANGLILSPAPSFTPLNPTDPMLMPRSNDGTCSSVPDFHNYTAGLWWNFLYPVGDVNGDGFDDVLTPANVVNNSWGGSCALDMVLYYGSPSGIQTSILPATPPTASGLNPAIVTHYAMPSMSGSQRVDTLVSYGDFNGDGYSDFIMADRVNERAFVIYGSANGAQTDGLLQLPGSGGLNMVSVDPCIGTVPNLSCKAQLLTPPSAGKGFADAVAGVGDLNHDGYDDAVVGESKNAVAGTDNGAAYVYFGSPKGLKNWGATTSGLIVVPGLPVAQTGRNAGYTVGPAGDVNGDGFADFAIGAWNDKAFGTAPSGAAYLFYGCGNGMNGGPTTPGCTTGVWGVDVSGSVILPASMTINTTGSCTGSSCKPLVFAPTNVTTISGVQSACNWGYKVGSPGDVNKDGYSDVLITASWANIDVPDGNYAGNHGVGAAVLYTGGPNGLNVGAAPTKSPTCNGGQCSPYWLVPSTSGWGMTSVPFIYYAMFVPFYPKPADFNGDGRPDLLIPSFSFFGISSNTVMEGGFYLVQ